MTKNNYIVPVIMTSNICQEVLGVGVKAFLISRLSGDMVKARTGRAGFQVMGFGSRLRKKREELGFSQEELANKTSVSRNTIMKFEKGSLPQGENLVALCRALQVSADWLLFGLGEGFGADESGLFADHGLGDLEGAAAAARGGSSGV